MSKYRVIEKNGSYFVEERILYFFWHICSRGLGLDTAKAISIQFENNYKTKKAKKQVVWEPK